MKSIGNKKFRSANEMLGAVVTLLDYKTGESTAKDEGLVNAIAALDEVEKEAVKILTSSKSKYSALTKYWLDEELWNSPIGDIIQQLIVTLIPAKIVIHDLKHAANGWTWK